MAVLVLSPAGGPLRALVNVRALPARRQEPVAGRAAAHVRTRLVEAISNTEPRLVGTLVNVDTGPHVRRQLVSNLTVTTVASPQVATAVPTYVADLQALIYVLNTHQTLQFCIR